MKKKIVHAVLIALILMASLLIFLPRQTAPSGLLISQPNFVLELDQRAIEIIIENRNDEAVELQQLFINDILILTWSPEETILEKGEYTNATISYHWLPEKEYIIDVYASPSAHGQVKANSPVIEPSIMLQTGNAVIQETNGTKTISVQYEIESLATDWIHIIFFTYRSYNESNRPLYVFYDEAFMASSSIRRANKFIELALNYSILAQKVDYEELESITEARLPSIVIFFDPLMDWQGKEVHDALPEAVLDPNSNGHVRDDSYYDKSLIYDWMNDDGLIFITVGSTQPHKYILRADKRVVPNRDSFKWNDAGFFFTSAGNESDLLLGNFGLGDYTPTRITGSLGIARWWSLQGFDKDAMHDEAIDFYSYGDYDLLYQGVVHNITLPVFVKVGKGGWLAFGDDYNQMSDDLVIHDLIMILSHSPWDSLWVPFGWYWDNGASFYQTQDGRFNTEGTLFTGGIPSHLFDSLEVRVLAIAYNSDYDKILIEEEIMELS